MRLEHLQSVSPTAAADSSVHESLNRLLEVIPLGSVSAMSGTFEPVHRQCVPYAALLHFMRRSSQSAEGCIADDPEASPCTEVNGNAFL